MLPITICLMSPRVEANEVEPLLVVTTVDSIALNITNIGVRDAPCESIVVNSQVLLGKRIIERGLAVKFDGEEEHENISHSFLLF